MRPGGFDEPNHHASIKAEPSVPRRGGSISGGFAGFGRGTPDLQADGFSDQAAGSSGSI